MKKKVTISLNDELYEWLEEMSEREDQRISTMAAILLDRMRLWVTVQKELEKK